MIVVKYNPLIPGYDGEEKGDGMREKGKWKGGKEDRQCRRIIGE
jgi:hypothetical protein